MKPFRSPISRHGWLSHFVASKRCEGHAQEVDDEAYVGRSLKTALCHLGRGNRRPRRNASKRLRRHGDGWHRAAASGGRALGMQAKLAPLMLYIATSQSGTSNAGGVLLAPLFDL